MKVFLRDIKERLPELEILNYREDVSFSKFSHDTRELEKDSLYIPIVGENFDGNAYISEALSNGSTLSLCEESKRDMVKDVTSPVILTGDILDTLGKILDIALEDIRNKAKIIAVTGSTGKTTTREMLSCVLSRDGGVLHSSKNFNTLWGNAEVLDDYTDERYIVLEFGVDKPGEIVSQCKAINPDAGILLNIGFVHAGPLGGIENIYKEKKVLADTLSENNGFLALNIDDERLRRIEKDFQGKLMTFGKDITADVKILDTILSEGGTRVKITFNGDEYDINLKILGKGYVYNACAVFCIGLEMGMSPLDIVSGLEEYEGFEGRFEIINLNENVDIINDAYNANPTSMDMAIDTFNELYRGKYEDMVLILGDMKELGEYTEEEHRKIGNMVKDLGFKQENVYFLGEYYDYFGYGQRLLDLEDTKEVVNRYINTNRKVIFLIKGSHGSELYKLPGLLP